MALDGVLLPSVAEDGLAKKERAQSEFIAASSERVFEDVVFVGAEIFDNLLLSVLERLGVDGSGGGLMVMVEDNHLAQDAETSMHAAFAGELIK